MKKKHVAKLLPGESVLVVDYSILMHLAETCDIIAMDQESESDADAWRGLADEIRFQSEQNLYVADSEPEEDWE